LHEYAKSEIVSEEDDLEKPILKNMSKTPTAGRANQ